MKQTINLFRADLLPPQPLLDLRRLLFVILAVWIVMVGWRVTLEIMDLSLRSQLTQVQSLQQQRQSELAAVAQQVAQLRVDPELPRTIRALEAELQNKRGVLSQFGHLDDMQMFDYAALLTELAQSHKDGVWLKRIHENNGVLNLYGGTSDPAVLPSWIQSFRSKSHLSEREFGNIRITREDDNALSFSVTGVERTSGQRSAESEPSERRRIRQRVRLEDFIE